MARRKQPPAGSSFATKGFRDPSGWLPAYEAYLTAECGMSANTVAAYRRDLAKFFDWNRDHRSASVFEIDIALLTEFIDVLRRRDLAPGTIARNLVAIRMFFRYLMLEGVISESVVDLLNAPKLWQKLPRVLSPQMVNELLNAPTAPHDRYALRDRAILSVMYATGCRVSEVAGLRLQDLQLEEGYCRCLGKGNKERLVSLNGPTIGRLQDYIRRERSDRLSGNSRDSGFLFLSRSGRRMNREAIWELIRRYAVRIGCGEGVSPHTLRHSFATHMLAGGADIRALQEMLGHASIRTTQVYTHVEHSRLKSVHEQCHPRG